MSLLLLAWQNCAFGVQAGCLASLSTYDRRRLELWRCGLGNIVLLLWQPIRVEFLSETDGVTKVDMLFSYHFSVLSNLVMLVRPRVDMDGRMSRQEYVFEIRIVRVRRRIS